MDAARQQASAAGVGHSGTARPQIASAESFGWLTKNRQILVFQTIQDALTATPQRSEATFENVVKAYNTLTTVVNIASNGKLRDKDLADLQADVQAVGGIIAPGLRSEGDNSLASFRSSTYGLLDRAFAPSVAESIQAALNARLHYLKHHDIGDVFQAIADFLSPLSSPPGSNASLDRFHDLDNERKCRVFETLRDAIAANPPRVEATFDTVVSAFQAEVSILKKAANGQISDHLLNHLQTSVRLAGGKLYPDVYAEGESSIDRYRKTTFAELLQVLAPDVFAAVTTALNSWLNRSSFGDISSLFKEISFFLNPLLADYWDTPSLKDFRSLDTRRQVFVYRTIDHRIVHRGDFDLGIFQLIVKAYSLERNVMELASQGMLTVECLLNLRHAIEVCGGHLASSVYVQGESTLNEFIDLYLERLKAAFPADVFSALLMALNAKLSTSTIQDFEDILTISKQFIAPILAGLSADGASAELVDTTLTLRDKRHDPISGEPAAAAAVAPSAPAPAAAPAPAPNTDPRQVLGEPPRQADEELAYQQTGDLPRLELHEEPSVDQLRAPKPEWLVEDRPQVQDTPGPEVQDNPGPEIREEPKIVILSDQQECPNIRITATVAPVIPSSNGAAAAAGDSGAVGDATEAEGVAAELNGFRAELDHPAEYLNGADPGEASNAVGSLDFHEDRASSGSEPVATAPIFEVYPDIEADSKKKLQGGSY